MLQVPLIGVRASGAAAFCGCGAVFVILLMGTAVLISPARAQQAMPTEPRSTQLGPTAIAPAELNADETGTGRTNAVTRFFDAVWRKPNAPISAPTAQSSHPPIEPGQAVSSGQSLTSAIDPTSAQPVLVAPNRLAAGSGAGALTRRLAAKRPPAFPRGSLSAMPAPMSVDSASAVPADGAPIGNSRNALLAVYPSGAAMGGAQALEAWRTTFATPATVGGTLGALPLSPPQSVVEALHEVVLAVGRNADTLGFQGRRARLNDAVRDGFFLVGMAQFAVGDHWHRMTARQRGNLIESFSRILVALFADRFDFDYDHVFETVGVTQFDDFTVQVDTDIVLPIGHRVRIAYVMRPVDGRWRIIDVLPPPGYSEAFARRDEYLSVIARRGLVGLFNALETMVASFETR